VSLLNERQNSENLPRNFHPVTNGMKVIIVFVVLVVALAWAFAPPSVAGLVTSLTRQTRLQAMLQLSLSPRRRVCRRQLALSASGDDEKKQSIPQIDVVANIARLKAMAAQLKAGEGHLWHATFFVVVKTTPLYSPHQSFSLTTSTLARGIGAGG